MTSPEDELITEITIDGEPFDTSRISGKEIEDWMYPFMMRKVKWNGIFEELSAVIGSDSYEITFIGDEKWLDILKEECPQNIRIMQKSAMEKKKLSEKEMLLTQLCAALSNRGRYIYRLEQLFPILTDAFEKNSSELYQSAVSQLNVTMMWDINNKIKNSGIPMKFLEKYRNELLQKAEKLELSAEQLYQMGKECYDCGDYDKSVNYFHKAEEKGDRLSLKYLAECYYYGRGAKKSSKKALKYCDKYLWTACACQP